MKNIQKLEFHAGSKEELLPDFEPEFPYIASNAELDQYADHSAPWHWHKAIELFYMESGELSFPSGFGGFINSSMLCRLPQSPRLKYMVSGLIILYMQIY